MTTTLPIDALLPELLSTFEQRGAVVLQAATGAGKTTRVPWAIASQQCNAHGQVLVLEPRRLAARLAAERVANEIGERVGGRVGFAVRYERKASAKTRLLFMTEALLTRRLQQDPQLLGVSAVVLDEIHERNLHSDLALALIASLRKSRNDLRWIAMSATLDGSAIASRFDAAMLKCPGRQYPVTISHATKLNKEPLDRQVATTVRQLLRDGVTGHILVFLPSMGEITRARKRCEALARDHHVALHQLHGRLPRKTQDLAVAPSRQQKVIFATNVAESSITIEGIEAVVDSGLANVASKRAWSSLTQLRAEPISQAAVTQRAGRAGRTGPGRCVRLFSEHDLARRPPFDVPTIERSDLCELLLTLSISGVRPEALQWLTPPPENALAAARQLLTRIDAIDECDRPRPDAAVLCGMPLHPRAARALLEAARAGISSEAVDALAVISEQADLRPNRPGQRRQDSSLWQQLDLLESHRSGAIGGPQNQLRQCERAAGQLTRLTRRHHRTPDPNADITHTLMVALLRGYPDRVAKRVGKSPPQQGQPIELAMVDGGRAFMRELRSLSSEGFTLILAAHERPNQPAQVHLAMPVTADALLDAFAEQMEDQEQRLFHVERERLQLVSQLVLGKLVIDESRKTPQAGPENVDALLAAIDKRGLQQVLDQTAWETLRMRLTRALSQDADVLLRESLSRLCAEHVSFAELRQRDVLATLLNSLSAEQRGQLKRSAPARIRLHSGKELKVHYPAGAPPFVESYVQDFFSMTDTPKLGGEALVLKLWAPNRRPLQVSRDLAGFWRNHYPALKRQLARRYPRHHFPDNPESAKAALLKRHL